MTKKVESVILNEKLMNDFSNKMEKCINTVCKKHPNVDPRVELLVTLSLFAAQIATDAGYNKNEFLSIMEDIFNDFDQSLEKSNHNFKISQYN